MNRWIFPLLLSITCWKHCVCLPGTTAVDSEQPHNTELANVGTTANVPSWELSALYDLYQATMGDNWDWRPVDPFGNHWNFTIDANPCEPVWQGLNCTYNDTAAQYNIAELHLPNYNLHGMIPATIGYLSQLTVMIFSDNFLNGHIPMTIGNLTQLEHVSIFNNQLSGPLPHTIGALRQLKGLSLYSNRLTSSIPASIGYLTQLVTFEAYKNLLTGPLPDTIGNLAQVRTMVLYHNALQGHIPETIGLMQELTVLDLDTNDLSGSLPETLGDLQQLQYLVLYDNYLTGQLPDSLGNLTSLLVLKIYYNDLFGTVPAVLGNLASLQTLDLYENVLEGTLPTELGQLTQLQFLGLNGNRFRYRIPASYGNLVNLQRLYLQRNLLTGPLPETFANLHSIQYLNLYFNLLDGTLPTYLGNLSNMVDLGLDQNKFTGTIPACIGNLTVLRSLYLDANNLHGTVPSEVGQLSILEGLFLNDNDLTGPLPAFLTTLTQLRDIEIGGNRLTGTIPAALGTLTQLQYLYLDNMLLHGTIPSELGYLPGLQFFSLSQNVLSGTIPSSFATMRTLRELQLYDNNLSGNLYNVFNASVQTSLNTVLLASNQLTGELPAELFRLTQLNTVVVVGNCFHGKLPSTICGADEMKSLVLDGLSSSRSCRNTFLPGATSSYTISTSVYGQVPACLFAMPKLNTLHMSGNGFTGSLPSDLTISPNLIDVTLSHNKLIGSIPAAIQRRQWYNLDLSYNRIDGTLVPDFASNLIEFTHDVPDGLLANRSIEVSLSLENNRLSGEIPGSVLYIDKVSILGSNVFSCRLDETDLPDQDNGKSSYECGSIAFEVPYYLWLGLMALSVVAVVVVIRYGEVYESHYILTRIARTVRKWLEYSSSKMTRKGKSQLNVFNNVIGILIKIAAVCALFIVFVLLPAYSLLSPYYGALTHQYAWGVSGAFLNGIVPLAVEFPLLLGLLVLALLTFATLLVPRLRYEAKHRGTLAPTRPVESDPYHEVLFKKTIIYMVYIAINLFVVIGFNVAYVYVSIYEDSSYHVLAQILLSLFKIIWNNVCTSIVLRSIVCYITASESIRDAKYSENEFVSLQVLIGLVNNIAIPCLVVAVVSPSCFYSIFVPAPSVTSYYTYQYCAIFDADTGDCSNYLPQSSSSTYNPPFIYNYQCSFSLVTFYSPAFVSLCIVASFVAPLAQLLLRLLHERARPGTYWFRLLDMMLPQILKPPPTEGDSESPGPALLSPDRTYFKANQVLITVLTYLGLLLTFGAMFPPLAVAIAVTILAWAFFAKLKVGRFLSIAIEQKQLRFVDIVETECTGVGSVTVLKNAMWMLITISCWFYTLFLFDTLGDTVGFERAYWVLIVMPLMPLFLYLTFALYSRRVNALAAAKRTHSTSSSNTSNSQRGDYELRIVLNGLVFATAQEVEEGSDGSLTPPLQSNGTSESSAGRDLELNALGGLRTSHSSAGTLNPIFASRSAADLAALARSSEARPSSIMRSSEVTEHASTNASAVSAVTTGNIVANVCVPDVQASEALNDSVSAPCDTADVQLNSVHNVDIVDKSSDVL